MNRFIHSCVYYSHQCFTVNTRWLQHKPLLAQTMCGAKFPLMKLRALNCNFLGVSKINFKALYLAAVVQEQFVSDLNIGTSVEASAAPHASSNLSSI